MEWFYGDDDEEQKGPLTFPDLRRLYNEGMIRDDTLVWNEGMENWEEIGSLKEVMAKIKQPPPPPKTAPSIAPPPAPKDDDNKDDWVVVSPSNASKAAPQKPSPPNPPPHQPVYTDNGDGYNSIDLKTTGYRDGEGGVSDSYTPGWALDDSRIHDVMHTSNVDDELARTLNIMNEPKESEVTNNLGLKVTSKALPGSMYGDYSIVGGGNSGGRVLDYTVDDHDPTYSSSLHRKVMDRTGIVRGTVKGQRAAAFGGLRGEEVKELGPGLKMIVRKSKDNRLDVIYGIINESNGAVTVTLDFDGSEGVELVEPVNPSGSMKAVRVVEGNDKVQVARIVQREGRAGGVRLACSVRECRGGGAGGGGGVGGRGGKQVRAQTRRKSINVAGPERKQLAPNLFLLKQKISSPLGYCYSVENGRSKDYEFHLDFGGSRNVRMEGGEGQDTKVKVVVPPGDTVVVATVVQADVTEGIAVKTKMGVRELATKSKPRGGVAGVGAPGVGGVESKGPQGSALKRCCKSHRAAKGDEMDVLEGDEVFLQGGNAGGGDSWVVGVNARSGVTGLVPAECLEDAVEGDSGGGRGSFNNVYRKGKEGWRGGKGKNVEGLDVSIKRPPPPVPSKKKWEPRAQVIGQVRRRESVPSCTMPIYMII